MLRITSNLSVLLLPVAVVLSGFAPMAKAATGGSRVELVVAFVQSHEETLSQEILSQASILEELGVAGTSVEGAAFQYPMAFLEAFIKDGVEPGISSAEQLVIDSKQVTVPFCLKNRCIFTTFDEDAETGQMEMVSYGGSVRAWRVATAHQRLKQFRPDYKGPIKIVEYPAGRLDFLVIDGNDGKKIFLPATEEQAERLGAGGNELAFLGAADLSKQISKIDEIARKTTVPEGLTKPSTPVEVAAQVSAQTKGTVEASQIDVPKFASTKRLSQRSPSTAESVPLQSTQGHSGLIFLGLGLIAMSVFGYKFVVFKEN